MSPPRFSRAFARAFHTIRAPEYNRHSLVLQPVKPPQSASGNLSHVPLRSRTVGHDLSCGVSLRHLTWSAPLTRSVAQAKYALRQQIGLPPPHQLVSPTTSILPEQAPGNYKAPTPLSHARRPTIRYHNLAMTIAAMLYCLTMLYINYNHAVADQFVAIETRKAQLAFGGSCTVILAVIQLLFRPICPVELLDEEPLERDRKIFNMYDPLLAVLFDLGASGLGFGLVLWTCHPSASEIDMFDPDAAKTTDILVIIYTCLGCWLVWLCLMLFKASKDYQWTMELKMRNNESALASARKDYWSTVILSLFLPVLGTLVLLTIWYLIRGFLNRFIMVRKIWSIDTSALLQQCEAEKDH